VHWAFGVTFIGKRGLSSDIRAMVKVGSRYLDHLLLERQYAQAAALCPKLLHGSAPAWERYRIVVFDGFLCFGS
jgi:hypothetical protein